MVGRLQALADEADRALRSRARVSSVAAPSLIDDASPQARRRFGACGDDPSASIASARAAIEQLRVERAQPRRSTARRASPRRPPAAPRARSSSPATRSMSASKPCAERRRRARVRQPQHHTLEMRGQRRAVVRRGTGFGFAGCRRQRRRPRARRHSSNTSSTSASQKSIADRPAARPLAVVALEVPIDAAEGDLERHALLPPSRDTRSNDGPTTRIR